MYYKVDIYIAHSNPLLYKLNILDICRIHINFQITSLLIYSLISYIRYMYMYCIFILNKARQLIEVFFLSCVQGSPYGVCWRGQRSSVQLDRNRSTRSSGRGSLDKGRWCREVPFLRHQVLILRAQAPLPKLWESVLFKVSINTRVLHCT